VFIDYGSGKGRALLLASDYPFHKIVGIEYVPSLHEVAESNCRTYHSDRQQCRAFELHCVDAAAYPLPAEPVFLFLSNPFGEELMTRVTHNVSQSLRENPRPFIVVYFNPQLPWVWDAVEQLQRAPIRQPKWPFRRPSYAEPSVLVWATPDALGTT
jgi:hypothetical protein